MDFELSRHAREEMERRAIPKAVVESVLADPDQVVEVHGGIVCHQSRWEFGGKPYLVRIMASRKAGRLRVVTVYRTSKIEKYWRPGP